MANNISQRELVESLSDFVKHVCRDRDSTHGFKHMQTVWLNSMKIYDSIDGLTSDIKTITTIVAWLHDVFDHKYDQDGRLLIVCRDFLSNILKLTDTEIDYIIAIINRISYSTQIKMINKFGKVDWLDVLGENGMIIRSIVSDADKLEALGKAGLQRCIDYTIMELGQSYDVNELKRRVTLHSIDKLFGLDVYITTELGKSMAANLKNEFINAYIEFMKNT